MKEENIQDTWERYIEERSPELRDRLLVNYLPVVKYVVGRLAPSLPPHVDRADLISIGILGLVDAIARFDLGKNTKFETYAVPRIKGEIIDHLRSLDWVPRSIRARITTLEKCYEEILVTTGQRADEKTICEHMKISADDYNRLMEYYTCLTFLSLNQLLGSESSSANPVELADVIKDEKAISPRRSAQDRETRDILSQAINELSDQERLSVVLYYYQELMLKEIGIVLSVSESRVSQILASAIMHLRAKLKKFKEIRS